MNTRHICQAGDSNSKFQVEKSQVHKKKTFYDNIKVNLGKYWKKSTPDWNFSQKLPGLARTEDYAQHPYHY